MAKRRSLRPAGWTWANNLSHDLGVQVDDTIWVSGMVAFAPEGDIIGLGDMRIRQYRRGPRTRRRNTGGCGQNHRLADRYGSVLGL